MMRIFKGRIGGRGLACLITVAVAAWLLPDLIENRRNALEQQVAQEQYETQLRYHYSQHAYLPAGNVDELFARIR